MSAGIEHADELSGFEYDFLESISDAEDEGGPFGSEYVLSEKQVKILDKIQTKLEDANLL